jgi:hypothetical protein
MLAGKSRSVYFTPHSIGAGEIETRELFEDSRAMFEALA